MDRTVLGKIEKDQVFVEPEVYQRLTRVLRNTLNPVALVNAIGYPVNATSEANLPPGLVDLLARLGPDDFAVIERIARGLSLVPASRSRTEPRRSSLPQPAGVSPPAEPLRSEGQP